MSLFGGVGPLGTFKLEGDRLSPAAPFLAEDTFAVALAGGADLLADGAFLTAGGAFLVATGPPFLATAFFFTGVGLFVVGADFFTGGAFFVAETADLEADADFFAVAVLFGVGAAAFFAAVTSTSFKVLSVTRTRLLGRAGTGPWPHPVGG